MRIRTCLLVLLFCLSARPALAQETRGNISGTVQDATGVIPGATVTITNVDTRQTQQLTTNGSGYFEVPLLNPGNYQVTVAMPNFKTLIQNNIVLSVGQAVSLTLKLEVGQVTEHVDVTAEAPILDTNTVSSGQNFDQKTLDNMPMISNMPVMVARFSPGVNPITTLQYVAQGFIDGTTNAAGGTVGGVGFNNFTIDGATNSGSDRRLASSPNSDMIQEMRVESSNFDASIGHGMGNTISMMTRAGTNAMRGSGNYQYWTNRLNSLNAQQKTTFATNDFAEREFRKGARTTRRSLLAARSSFPNWSTAGTNSSSLPIIRKWTTRRLAGTRGQARSRTANSSMATSPICCSCRIRASTSFTTR